MTSIALQVGMNTTIMVAGNGRRFYVPQGWTFEELKDTLINRDNVRIDFKKSRLCYWPKENSTQPGTMVEIYETNGAITAQMMSDADLDALLREVDKELAKADAANEGAKASEGSLWGPPQPSGIKKCDCGAKTAKTTHARWCSTGKGKR